MPYRYVHYHYLLPSALAALLVIIYLLVRERGALRRLFLTTGRVAPALVPRILAITTFLAGAILLFSGATPAMRGRLGWLDDFLPLPIVEVSHFFGSLAGAGLLILARGLQRRLDAAYHLTLGLLGAGILFSLLKAFDWEEAVFLSLMLAALVPSRKYFYRKASLFSERFTRGWIAAIWLVVVGSIILGWLSYRNIGLDTGMFWDFSIRGQAPRFLRATAGVVAFLVILGLARLIRPAPPKRTLPTPEQIEAVRPIVERSPEAAAHLAFLGDKSLMVNEAGTGFVMYSVAGRSWVALGDPVAPPEEIPELAIEYIRLCDRHGGWPVFYKVARQHLYLYLDLGFSIVKLGEEARVPLTDFSLEGPQRRNLRRVWRKAVEEGCSVDVLAPEQVRDILPQLRAISDEWLAAKNTREKRFSLGFFSDPYVSRYPVGVVQREGRIVAFANLWPSGCHEELEVDLMRFSAAAPPGIMRYLLVELMIWGRDQGYRWFNLGMAPLSGLRTSSIAPLWNQLGAAIFGRGERFYNFQGIREFKQWFYPVWEPQYLVSPGGALRPVILANVAALIAGGLEGVVRK